MVDHESQGDVQFDEKALARVMGRAYADDAYREVLTSSPSETLEQAGALASGSIATAALDAELEDWDYAVHHDENGAHLRIGLPDLEEELDTSVPEDGLTAVCCCCCPC